MARQHPRFKQVSGSSLRCTLYMPSQYARFSFLFLVLDRLLVLCWRSRQEIRFLIIPSVHSAANMRCSVCLYWRHMQENLIGLWNRAGAKILGKFERWKHCQDYEGDVFFRPRKILRRHKTSRFPRLLLIQPATPFVEEFIYLVLTQSVSIHVQSRV